MHYWWFRVQDGLIKDRDKAVKRSVSWIMVSIAKDKELFKAFRLDNANAKSNLMKQLYGEINSFLLSLESAESNLLPQDGKNAPINVYKPVKLAARDNIPLYELVAVPVVHPHGTKTVALEIRIYESEPATQDHMYVGHWSGVKKMIKNGKFGTYSKAKKHTHDQQDQDMLNAVQQYSAAEKRGWK